MCPPFSPPTPPRRTGGPCPIFFQVDLGKSHYLFFLDLATSLPSFGTSVPRRAVTCFSTMAHPSFFRGALTCFFFQVVPPGLALQLREKTRNPLFGFRLGSFAPRISFFLSRWGKKVPFFFFFFFFFFLFFFLLCLCGSGGIDSYFSPSQFFSGEKKEAISVLAGSSGPLAFIAEPIFLVPQGPGTYSSSFPPYFFLARKAVGFFDSLLITVP